MKVTDRTDISDVSTDRLVGTLAARYDGLLVVGHNCGETLSLWWSPDVIMAAGLANAACDSANGHILHAASSAEDTEC